MSKGHILVVDDNPNLLELIKMRLESEDYKVSATADEELRGYPALDDATDEDVAELVVAAVAVDVGDLGVATRERRPHGRNNHGEQTPGNEHERDAYRTSSGVRRQSRTGQSCAS